MSRTIELIAGVLLLVIGVVVLASGPLIDFVSGVGIDDDVLAWWPMLLIGLSLFFLVPSLVGRQHRRLRAGLSHAGDGGRRDARFRSHLLPCRASPEAGQPIGLVPSLTPRHAH